MGKKSRRPTNRNKPKDIPGAVASPPVAVPRQVAASGASQDSNQSTFMQLCVSQDWEGALELESEMSVIANRSESSNPSLACRINCLC